MANLLSTTINGALIENEGTAATGEVTLTLPQKGSTVVFESTNTVTFASSAYDASTNKYVVAFRDDTDGGKGKAVVGTPSGDSIVWGTPVQFSTAATTIDTTTNAPSIGFCMQYDPDTERILIAWSEGNFNASPGKGTSKVGAVSGTGTSGTITFGAEGIFDTGNKGLMSDKERFAHQMAYDTNQNKMVLTWSPMIAGKGGVASVGTIVGGGTNSITWGTPVDVEPVVGGGSNGEFSFVSIIYDTASQNIVIAWEGNSNGSAQASYVRVGTVSGTSITFGTKIAHMPFDADDSSLGYDPVAEKIILIYTDYGNWHGHPSNRAGVARVGTVSGSGATATCYLGEPTTFSVYASKACDIVYNASAARHIINYMTYESGNAGGGTPGATYEHLLAKSAKVTSVTLSCTTTSSSTTVTTADTSSLVVGMSVNGTGMGVGAYAGTVTNIASITNSTTFVLDTAATASGTSTLGFTILHDFSAAQSIETSGLQTSINDFNMNISYNTTDHRVLVPRPTGDSGADPNGTIIKSTSTGLTADLATGSFFEVDFESTTDQIAELVISNPQTSYVSSFVLQITQGSTARDINWVNDSKIKWPGGTAPTLTTTNNKVDIFSFSTWDNGTTWYGKVIGQNF